MHYFESVVEYSIQSIRPRLQYHRSTVFTETVFISTHMKIGTPHKKAPCYHAHRSEFANSVFSNVCVKSEWQSVKGTMEKQKMQLEWKMEVEQILKTDTGEVVTESK